MYNFYLTIRALNEYKPGHISSCFSSSSNYSQWLFGSFKSCFSERGTRGIFRIAASLRVLEKRVSVLQSCTYLSGCRRVGSLCGMVLKLILGCWSDNQLEFSYLIPVRYRHSKEEWQTGRCIPWQAVEKMCHLQCVLHHTACGSWVAAVGPPFPLSWRRSQ